MKKINKYIKDPFLIGFWIVMRMAPLFKNDELYLRMLYFLSMHERLDLKKPQTFGEKMQWLKLYNRNPEFTMMVDKCAVKDYVAQIIGEEYIIPTIGVWDKLDDIDFDNLPNKFVLKTTHGGGSVGVVICRDKHTFDKKRAIKKLKKSMKQNLYIESREWPYKDVKRRIIAEPLLGDDDTDAQDLTDYKFFCFDGEPRYCQVIRDRHSQETIDFFDMNWTHQEFIGLNPVAVPAVTRPSRPTNYEKMQKIAKALSKDIIFSRIDLYEVNDKIYFGEITFYPNSGFGTFTPTEYNWILGNMIVIPAKSIKR